MLIKVHVNPGSKEERVVRVAEDKFKVNVGELPEKGAANVATARQLAVYFAVPAGKIRLIKGAHESHKIFEIKD